MKTETRLALLAALALVALAALALGTGDDENTSASGNATDAAFITDMTAHHDGAIDMARIAKQRAEHPEIRQLADDIAAAQKGEISVMQFIGEDMHAMGQHGNGHMGMSEAEMGMDIEPAMLRDARPFDRAFIDMMVPHHQGAIAMAERLLASGAQPALRRIARDIIDAQRDQVTQMRKWRKAWYGSAEGDAGALHGQ